MNEQDRAAYRAFVRDNHPDRGGDPDVFVAGLARFRDGAERVSPFPSASGADGDGDARSADPPRADPPRADPSWADPSWNDPRWDAPLEFVTPLPAPVRVAVALIRTLRWHRRRRVQ
jgi:hypothetical protein